MSAPPELSGNQLDQDDASEPGRIPLTDDNPYRIWNPGRPQLRMLLYSVCCLVDFAVSLVIFMVTRTLAERHFSEWYLGMIGAGLSFVSGIGNLAGGWLASHWNGPAVFVTGALGMVGCIVACLLIDPASPWFLPGFWLIGIAAGFIYPPLVGWLNHGDDAHAHRALVSQRLILYCIAWNVGMMCGPLFGGELFQWGPYWTLGGALAAAILNFLIALRVAPLARSLPPVPAMAHETVSAESIAQAVLFKRLGWISNLGGVFGGGIVMYLLSPVMVELGIQQDAHGRLLAGWRVAIIATYALLHVSVFWHYRLWVSLSSQLFGAVGLVVLSLADTPFTLLAGLALHGQLVGFNYFSGLYYGAAGSSHQTRAFAAGIHEATLAAGMAAGTFAAGYFGSRFGNRSPYQLAAGVIVFLTLMQIIAWWKWRPQRIAKNETRI